MENMQSGIGFEVDFSLNTNVSNRLGKQISKINEEVKKKHPLFINVLFDEKEVRAKSEEILRSTQADLSKAYKGKSLDAIQGYIKEIDKISLASKKAETEVEQLLRVFASAKRGRPEGSLIESDKTDKFLSSSNKSLTDFIRTFKELYQLYGTVDSDAISKLVPEGSMVRQAIPQLKEMASLYKDILEYKQKVGTRRRIEPLSELSTYKTQIDEATLKMGTAALNAKPKEAQTLKFASLVELVPQLSPTFITDAQGLLDSVEMTKEVRLKPIIDNSTPDSSAKQSADGINQESNALDNVRANAEQAAEKKRDFAKANEDVLNSIVESLKGLKLEGEGFKSLQSLLDYLNKLSTQGANGASSQIETIIKNINELRKAFNGGIDDNSLLSMLDQLLSRGESLKDLATVLKSTPKEIAAVQNAVGSDDNKSAERYKELAKERLEVEKSLQKAQTEVEILQQRGVATDDRRLQLAQANVQKFVQRRNELDNELNTLRGINNQEELRSKIEKVQIDEAEKREKAIARIRQNQKDADNKLGALFEGAGRYEKITDVTKDLDRLFATMGKISNVKVNEKTGKINAQLTDLDGNLKSIEVSLDSNGFARWVSTGQKQLNILQKAFGNVIASAKSFLRFYVSPTHLISFVRSGVNDLKEFDNALTSISYTMNISKNQLESLGEDILDIANKMNSSVQSATEVAQIYANMNTTSEEIKKLSEPTLILSNLTGMSASESANDIQAVVQQFDVLAEDSMHIVDTFDYVSKNIAVDYSKGIKGMSEAVEVAGATAKQAGLSYEQLSAIVGKTMEQTRQEGSQIGNGLKTIFTRLSKVGKLSDEVDNETLSNAASSLHKVGVEVYNLDGSYREFDVIMGELSDKWDSLTDAQKSNISYNIAATRQTNLLTSVLKNFGSSMQLAEEASRAEGSALENQEKYAESYKGVLQGLSTQAQTTWVHLLDSDGFKAGIKFLETMVSLVDKLVGQLGVAGTLITGLGINAARKNVGRGKMFPLERLLLNADGYIFLWDAKVLI